MDVIIAINTTVLSSSHSNAALLGTLPSQCPLRRLLAGTKQVKYFRADELQEIKTEAHLAKRWVLFPSRGAFRTALLGNHNSHKIFALWEIKLRKSQVWQNIPIIPREYGTRRGNTVGSAVQSTYKNSPNYDLLSNGICRLQCNLLACSLPALNFSPTGVIPNFLQALNGRW